MAKGKNKKSKLKRNIFIIAVAIIAVLIVVVLVLKFAPALGKVFESDEKKRSRLEKEITEVLDRNYQYYVLMYSDIKTGEGEVIYNDETYYIVDDSRVKDVDNILTLIKNTFTSGRIDEYFELIETSNNQYITVNDYLYVKKGEKICNTTHDVSIADAQITEDEDGRILVSWPEDYVYMRYEDGKLKSSDLFYECQDEWAIQEKIDKTKLEESAR